MVSYSFLSQAAAVLFLPLSSLLSPAQPHSQAPNWLKTSLNGEGQDGDRDELGKEGKRGKKWWQE